MIARILLTTFLLISFNATSQQWVTQYQEAQAAYTEGDLETALSVGQQSLKGYLEADGSLNKNYASILRLLTTTCYAAALYNEGIEYGKKEIQVRENIGETQNLEFATSLYNLGSLYEANGKAESSLNQFKEALAIYQQYYQPSDENVINCKWKIASSLVSLNNDAEAFIIYQKTLRLVEGQEAVTLDYINACNDYANLLIDKAQYQKALPYLLDLENVYSQLGTDYNYLLAQTYTNMGLCYHHNSQFQQAENAYNQANNLFTELSSVDDKAYLQMKNLRAINYKSMGESDKAAELLGTLNTSEDVVTRASALNNEAILKQQSGNIDEAKSLLLSAINLLVDSIDTHQTARAETLENLSSLYLITGKADSAQALAYQALKIKEESRDKFDKQSVANARHKLAKAQHALGLWNEALSNYNKAVDLLNNTTNNAKVAALIGDLAIYHQDKGDYEKADSLFTEQLNILKTIEGNQSISYATALNNAATLKQIQADFLSAKNLLTQALNIAKASAGADNLSYAGIAENLALVQMELVNYDEAEALMTQVITIRKTALGSEHPLYASALQNMGRLQQLKGKYQEAEPLFSRAMELKKQALGDTHPQYAHATNSMALLYQTMGNFNRAEPLFEAALAVYKNAYGTNHPEYATALENLATIKKLKGDNQKAADLLETALKIDEKVLGKNHPQYAITLHNLASSYKDLKRYEEAAQLFSQALIIDKKVFGENHAAYASTLYNLAVLQQELQQIDSAEINFQKALQIRKDILGSNHPDYAYSLYGLAGLYHLTREYEKARTYYDQVITNYLRQIDDFFPSLSEKEKSAFYGKIKPVISSFQDFAIEYAKSNPDSAHHILSDLYNLQLSTKALLLHASNKVRNRIFNSGDTELINTYQEWTEMKEQLSKYLSYRPEELTAQNIDILTFENKINDLEKYLSRQSETFAKEVDQGMATWKNIQQKLGPKEAALEIIRIKKRYITDSIMYIAMIIKPTSESPELVVLNEGNHLETRFFNYYRNAIKYTVGDEISYQQFWESIDSHLNNIDMVYASADGVFNKININTLYDPKQSKYVIDEYNVRSVSNTKELLDKKTQPDAQTNIAAVFGFPDFNLGLTNIAASSGQTRASEFGFSNEIPELPGTKTEVNDLNALLVKNGWQTSLFTKSDASENQVKQIENPRLLHIATHGFFMQDIDYKEDKDYGLYFNDEDYNPLFRSGLLLAGAAGAIYQKKSLDDEDGILTAYEAMNLNLDKTSLVVLSACETGVGEIKNGEGVYGLQRAFLVAGAESVIMSLWQVDDYTTQRLMILFYDNWLAGQDKFEAFKNAVKKLKEEFKDPFHWGAFIILGVE